MGRGWFWAKLTGKIHCMPMSMKKKHLINMIMVKSPSIHVLNSGKPFTHGKQTLLSVLLGLRVHRMAPSSVSLSSHQKCARCLLAKLPQRQRGKTQDIAPLWHRNTPLFGTFAKVLIDGIRYINAVCAAACAGIDFKIAWY